MSSIRQLMKQAQEMQGRMAKIKEELQAMTLSGTATIVASSSIVRY